MITANELPSNVCCKHFYFAVYTFLRGVIFAFFWGSVIYNDAYKCFKDLLSVPFKDDKEWHDHKSFIGV